MVFAADRVLGIEVDDVVASSSSIETDVDDSVFSAVVCSKEPEVVWEVAEIVDVADSVVEYDASVVSNVNPLDLVRDPVSC